MVQADENCNTIDVIIDSVIYYFVYNSVGKQKNAGSIYDITQKIFSKKEKLLSFKQDKKLQ